MATKNMKSRQNGISLSNGHAFYERADRALKASRSNRKEFCAWAQIPYSSLSTHWRTETLPKAEHILLLAQYTKQSISYLLGEDVGRPLSPATYKLINLLANLTDEQILEVIGAVKSYLMFVHLWPAGGNNDASHTESQGS